MLTRHRSPEILELRVHGVLNTPPAEMLQTSPDKITRRVGDDLGSFWSRTDQAPADGITVTEAFSWGAQARTGGGALAVISRVLVHLGWFLLLPYALANLAYWTRWVKSQTSAGSKTWDGGPGAAAVRVFGLLLTLIGVAAFSSVAIDLIAVQCFRGGTQVCAALPEVFDGLRGMTRDSRAALLGIAPIAAVVVLYLIGRRGRVRFEEPVKRFGAGLGDTPTEEGLPLLATRGFWSVSRVGQTSEWLHVAASISLVLFVLALDSAYVQVPGCWRGSGTITEACLTAAFDYPLPAWFAVSALLLLAATVILVVYSSHTPANAGPVLGRLGRMVSANTTEARSAWKRGAAMACLVLAVLGYAAWTILTLTRLTPQSESYPGFLGLVATPIALIVVAFFLALAGVGWKSGTTRARRIGSALFLVLGATALLASHSDAAMWGVSAPGWQWWLILAAGVCVLIHLWIAWTTPGDRIFVAWRGQAAAVVMILALFASMALCSLLVLGVGAWLGTPAGSPPTEYIWRTPLEPVPAALWNIPDAYERFAVILAVTAALLLVLVVASVAWNLIRFVRFSLPTLEWKDEEADTEGPIDGRGGLLTPDRRTYAPRLTNLDPGVQRRVGVRRSSHLLHRGEPLLGWLAVFAAIGFFSLSSSFVYEQAKSFIVALHVEPAAIRGTATAILVAIAVACAAAVAAHAASSSERPLGVFWDVVAFFPRAGHPFAPPCFGERAVPELSARAKSWVSDPKAGRPRAVILTAHSMGSTIAAATILSMRGETIQAGRAAGEPLADRLALLSYGSQLRAYFSRFFPSVFGPDILGVPGLRGPSLWQRDPWRAQVLAEFAPKAGSDMSREMEPLPQPLQDDQRSLTATLGAHGREVPRWRNLWRRTDYLGFPVYAYRSDGNPVDRGTTESVPDSYLWQIGTHSNYLGTPQFLLVRAELVSALRRATG